MKSMNETGMDILNSTQNNSSENHDNRIESQFSSIRDNDPMTNVHLLSLPLTDTFRKSIPDDTFYDSVRKLLQLPNGFFVII